MPLNCQAGNNNINYNTYYTYQRKLSEDSIIEGLKNDINEVFGTNKYDKAVERNILVKKELLSVIKKLKKIFWNLEEHNTHNIDNYFHDIFEVLLSDLASTQYRYKEGLIMSTRPYEVIVDLISYCLRLKVNAKIYIKYT